MTLSKFIEKIQSYPDCEKYTSAIGKKCYRTYGDYNWFVLQCSKLNLKPKMLESGYEAQGNGFTLEYIEHDIILAIS